MLFLLILPAVLALSGIDADVACEPSLEIQSCLTPLVTWSMTSEASEVYALRGREEEFTARQLVYTCKLVQRFTICVADFLARCVPANVTDLHDLARGTVKLMQVCERPDLYEKTKLIVACGKKLQTDWGWENCTDYVTDRMGYMQDVVDFPSIVAVMSNGHVMKDFCCTLKDVQICMEPRIARCAPGVEMRASILDAVLKAYGCQEKIAGGCQVQGGHT